MTETEPRCQALRGEVLGTAVSPPATLVLVAVGHVDR